MIEKVAKPVQEKGWAVDIGRHRDQNEDSVAAVDVSLVNGNSEQSIGIYAVADGVGGEDFGEVASSLAIQTLVSQIIQHITQAGKSLNQDYESWLEKAMQAANQVVFHDSKGMATTLVATLVVGHTAYIANVGDSRAYLLTPDGMEQITEDQSLVQIMLNSGVIDKRQAAKHPYRNMLSQTIGVDDTVEPDLYTMEIAENNYLLLCSDGLTNELDEQTIYNTIIRSGSPQAACETLVQKANQHGGRDNISVLIVRSASHCNQ